MNDQAETTTANPDFEGISTITVSYDGSGDSGGIESIDAYDAAGEPRELTAAQHEFVEERCYDLMPSGFENNEGGYGEIVINITDNHMSMDHTQRYDDWDTQDVQLTRAMMAGLRSTIGKENLHIAQRAGATILHLESEPDYLKLVLVDVNGRKVMGLEIDGLAAELSDHLERHFRPDTDEDSDYVRWALSMPLEHHPRKRERRSFKATLEIRWSVPREEGSGDSQCFDELKSCERDMAEEVG